MRHEGWCRRCGCWGGGERCDLRARGGMWERLSMICCLFGVCALHAVLDARARFGLCMVWRSFVGVPWLLAGLSGVNLIIRLSVILLSDLRLRVRWIVLRPPARLDGRRDMRSCRYAWVPTPTRYWARSVSSVRRQGWCFRRVGGSWRPGLIPRFFGERPREKDLRAC